MTYLQAFQQRCLSVGVMHLITLSTSMQRRSINTPHPRRFAAESACRPDVHPQPLVSVYADAQQSALSDECRMFAGRRDGVIHEWRGDVPLLAEESSIGRTFCDLMELQPQRSSPWDVAENETPSATAGFVDSGISVYASAFDEATDILICRANADAETALRLSAGQLDSVVSQEPAAAAGASTYGGLPMSSTTVYALGRRVWATETELQLYPLAVCDAKPNSVMEQCTGQTLYRTQSMWYCVRLYTAFDIATRQPFSPRVQVAIRRWCMMSRSWWSVWGTVEAFEKAGFSVVPDPLVVSVVDEWGEPWELVSAHACLDAEKVVQSVFSNRQIL